MTERELEGVLMAKNFNGTYSDADFDCVCSGNEIPVQVTETPLVYVPATETPTTEQTVTDTGTTMEEQITESLNNETITDDLYPTIEYNTGNGEFIEEPTLPTTSGSLASQTGSVDAVIEGVEENTLQAGGWLLGLVVAGIVLRELTKKKK